MYVAVANTHTCLTLLCLTYDFLLFFFPAPNCCFLHWGMVGIALTRGKERVGDGEKSEARARRPRRSRKSHYMSVSELLLQCLSSKLCLRESKLVKGPGAIEKKHNNLHLFCSVQRTVCSVLLLYKATYITRSK